VIRHIIFDLDGTLADTARATIAAFAEVAPEFSLPIPNPDAIRSSIGIANPMFYYSLYPAYNRKRVLACSREIEQAEEKCIRLLGRKILFDGVAEMLDELSSMGKIIHLASTGDPRHVDAVLQSGEIAHHFQSVNCGKADKEDMVRDIIGGISAGEWVMMGDHQKDIAAARANSIPIIGAGMGYVRERDRAYFDWIVPEPHAFVAWIRERV